MIIHRLSSAAFPCDGTMVEQESCRNLSNHNTRRMSGKRRQVMLVRHVTASASKISIIALKKGCSCPKLSQSSLLPS